MKSEKHKHSWVKISDTKVRCECGRETYISKLTPKQRESLKVEPPRYEPEPQDLLMWVGGSYYTIESFIAEARKMGVCKRVPMLPRGVVAGKSRVFLAHDKSEAEKKLGVKGKGRIFAYFIVRGISYVVKPGVNIPEELKARGVTEWEYVEGGFGFNDERGCGSLAIGGTYLLSEEDIEKCRDLADSGTLEGHIHVLNPTIPLSLKRFRGFKNIDGNAVLAGKPEREWFEGAHRKYLRNKKLLRRWRSAKRKLEMEESVEKEVKA